MELNFHGTHGTCRKYAELIERNGFKPGSSGLRGTGVYFWFYEDISYEAKMLAINWVDTANKWNHFGKHGSEKAILFVDLSVSSNYFLDLNDPINGELFNTYISKAAKAMIPAEIGDKEKRELMSKVYDWAISKFEVKFRTEYSLILSRVQAPDDSFYESMGDMKLYAQPLCLVVKSLGKVKVEIKELLVI